MSLHLSKCHVVGNHMSRLKFNINVVRSKVVVLLFIAVPLVLCLALVLLCNTWLTFLVLQSPRWGRERAVCFILIVFLMSCEC